MIGSGQKLPFCCGKSSGGEIFHEKYTTKSTSVFVSHSPMWTLHTCAKNVTFVLRLSKFLVIFWDIFHTKTTPHFESSHKNEWKDKFFRLQTTTASFGHKSMHKTWHDSHFRNTKKRAIEKCIKSHCHSYCIQFEMFDFGF